MSARRYQKLGKVHPAVCFVRTASDLNTLERTHMKEPVIDSLQDLSPSVFPTWMNAERYGRRMHAHIDHLQMIAKRLHSASKQQVS